VIALLLGHAGVGAIAACVLAALSQLEDDVQVEMHVLPPEALHAAHGHIAQ